MVFMAIQSFEWRHLNARIEIGIVRELNSA